MDKNSAYQLIEKNRKAYNSITYKFDQTRQKYPWQEFFEFKKYLKSGKKILDLGCGNGRLLSVLTDLRVDYLGIDNSQGLLEKARVNFPKNNFELADIVNYRISKDSYDCIFLLAVLHHIPTWEMRYSLLHKINHGLKPKGYLMMTNWNLLLPPYNRLRIFENIKRYVGKSILERNDLYIPFTTSDGKITVERYLHCFTKKELLNLATKTGFKVIEQSYGFKNFNHFSIWQKY